MDPDISKIIPVQYQIYVLASGIALKYLAEFYSSVKNGGGLRRIIMSFWFGENVPNVVAEDYKKELNTKSTPVPPTPTP